MPIKRCTLSNGKSGYKWGDSGKCYANREDALKQMRAIKFRQSQGKSWHERFTTALEVLFEEKKNDEQVRDVSRDT